MIDSGAQGYAFIDTSFAQHHHLALTPVSTQKTLHGFTGATEGTLGHFVTASSFQVGEAHVEADARFFAARIGTYPVILGIPWLRTHSVQLLFQPDRLRFNQSHLYCRNHCAFPASPPVAHGLSSPPKRDERKGIPSEKKKHESLNKAPSTPLQISMIGAAPFDLLCRRSEKDGSRVFAATVADIDKAITPSKHLTREQTLALLPAEYHDLAEVFSREKSDELPPHRPYDHQIILEDGKRPRPSPLYNMSQNELQELRNFLDENLTKGFIRASKSPVASPVLFVKKSNGELRFCVDYRSLNAITVKNRYPIPLIRETLDRLSKAKFYTKLDIIAAFNKLRMAEGHEWLTAFRTRYGQYESLVLPFGLCNGPSSFQHFINDVLFEYLDQFCTAYLDDILIYSTSLADHRRHVRAVLEKLGAAGLQVDVVKCRFSVTEVLFLGVLVSTQGLKMDPKKVQAVADWEIPRNTHDVRSFLGFANFYRRFIRDFAKIAGPITKLTKKNCPFHWSPSCNHAFQTLKSAFTSAPILAHFDPYLECVVETDASDFVCAGVLSQKHGNLLHPVAFFSKKNSPAECNYEIYDKELMAIIRAFEEWRSELEGSPSVVDVITDHRSLEYFMTTKKLTRRQARWSEFLSRFNFVIQYRPGRLGGKPDALTRRSGDLPKEGDERLQQQQQVVLKSENLASELRTTPRLEAAPAIINDNLEQLLSTAYEFDEQARKLRTAVRERARQHPLAQEFRISLSDCTVDSEDRLWYRSRLFVPNSDPLRLQLINDHHTLPSCGHPGVAKTYELLSRGYFWPLMKQTISRFIRNCHTCARAKPSRQRLRGLLKPLAVPSNRWEEISMDLVTGLPKTQLQGQTVDAVLVVIDRLTKMRHLIACSTDGGTTAPEIAKLFIRHVWKHHGLPRTIVSDRGPQFDALFWRHTCRRLGIKATLSTAFHPQTDGQTENANAFMEQYLRCYVTYLQDDWAEWLSLAEFASNNVQSDTTQLTPFWANLGHHPRMGTEPITTTTRDVRTRAQLESADQFVIRMDEILGFVRAEITNAQEAQETAANRHRQPAPSYQVGDTVWLSSRNFTTQRPARKLDWKNHGPFRVTQVVSPYAYRLELPATMKVHDVFHVSLLRPCSQDPLPGQIIAPRPPVVVDGEDEYYVEEILDSRRRRRRLQYLVKWAQYEVPTWEPYANVAEVEALDRFHAAYPSKPKPEQRDLILSLLEFGFERRG